MEQSHCYISPFTIAKKKIWVIYLLKTRGVGHGFNISVIVIGSDLSTNLSLQLTMVMR